MLILVLILILMTVAVTAQESKQGRVVDFFGNVKTENTYEEIDGKDSKSCTNSKVKLFTSFNPTERVEFFTWTMVKYDFNLNKTPKKKTTEDIKFNECWFKIDQAVGSLDLQIGRIDERSASEVLYDKYREELVQFIYQGQKFSGKIGHNFDHSDSYTKKNGTEVSADRKAVVAEFSAKDLGIVDCATLNYIDDNLKQVDGYMLNLDRDFGTVDTTLYCGQTERKIDQQDITGNILGLDLSVDIKKDLTLSFFYGQAEKGFKAEDGSLSDIGLQACGCDDYDVIKPGFCWRVNSKFNLEGGYALYDTDDNGEDNYLNLVAGYKLAPKTKLEVEYEGHNYDNTTQADEETVSTSVKVKF
ncbi:MAG: porin [Bacillota bacterium]